ncbi:hypothetical protein [Chlorobaculum limnaeum]|uniref:hypothetical protein n=1 Tax=Chlorobaculum limnaeum TaxID=274537 RepID=UPI0012ECD66E|nr:hypothetical protein [Chlorobaculum limnaeum]
MISGWTARNICGETVLVWVFFAGPLAHVLFEWILNGPPTTAGTIAAQGTLEIDDDEV